MTKNLVKIKNAKVSYSTMLNRIDKAKKGRTFIILVPADSPELAKIKELYGELNTQAKTVFGEKLGKKLKNADTDIFEESVYHEGFVELKFNVYNINEKELENEDGTKTTKLVENLNPMYKGNSRFCYFVDNNGNKIYETNTGKGIYPLSGNTVDITLSLVAKYNSQKNRPSILFKAEDVKIVESDFGNKSSSPSTGFLTLDGDDEDIQNNVEMAKTVDENEVFSENELTALDV